MKKNSSYKLLAYVIALVLFILAPIVVQGPYVVHVLILTSIYIVVASGLRLVDLTGAPSLAHGGMMTLGAYTSTLLVMKLGMSSWSALIISALLAALVAFILGFPFFRLKGIYFVLTTVFLTNVIILLIQQWDSLTGGSSGLYNIPRPDPIGIPGLFNITFDTRQSCYYLMLFIMVISLIFIYLVDYSRVGKIFRGIRQSDTLAESVGVNTNGYKIMAFTFSCFFSGLVGAFYSQYISAITPDTFGFLFGLYILIYMVVGGAAVFVGPIIGAFVFSLVPEVLRPLKDIEPLFFAALLMAVIFFLPEGIVGIPKRIQLAFFKKKRDINA